MLFEINLETDLIAEKTELQKNDALNDKKRVAHFLKGSYGTPAERFKSAVGSIIS